MGIGYSKYELTLTGQDLSSRLATMIAREMNFSSEQVEGVNMAAAIHDIGGISVSAHRPSRPACGIDYALEEISNMKGILYDTAVADACLRLFNEKGFMFE